MSERDVIAAARGAAHLLGLTGLPLADEAIRVGCPPRRLGWLVDVIGADRNLRVAGLALRALGNYRQDAGEPRYASAGAWEDARSGGAPGARLVAAAVKADRALTMAEVLGNADAAKLTCHDGITRVPVPLVALVAEKLGEGELLDLGCGDGALAAAVLAAAPGARARLVDRDIRAASRLRGARCEVIAADLATLEVAPANVVLLSNVLHTSTAPRELVARAAAHVAPGGALIVREVALAADRKGPRFALAFGLSLLLFGDAELPREDELAAWISPRERHRFDEAIVLVA